MSQLHVWLGCQNQVSQSPNLYSVNWHLMASFWHRLSWCSSETSCSYQPVIRQRCRQSLRDDDIWESGAVMWMPWKATRSEWHSRDANKLYGLDNRRDRQLCTSQATPFSGWPTGGCRLATDYEIRHVVDAIAETIPLACWDSLEITAGTPPDYVSKSRPKCGVVLGKTQGFRFHSKIQDVNAALLISIGFRTWSNKPRRWCATMRNLLPETAWTSLRHRLVWKPIWVRTSSRLLSLAKAYLCRRSMSTGLRRKHSI